MSRLVRVDILSILFGLGTWLCVNGLWVELPLLVQQLPEGWNLPSYLSVVIQIANLGPLLYTFFNSYFPKQVTEKRAIYLIMMVGLASTILLAMFWKKTTIVAGVSHSTALLTLVLFMALVDCSSRVTFLPFMARFQEIYLTSYFIGEGLSGFFPSAIALVQGVGGNPECRNNSFGNGTEPYSPDPLFSVDAFFYVLFVCTALSAIAFYCLTLDKVVEGAYSGTSVENSEDDPARRLIPETNDTDVCSSTAFRNTDEATPLVCGQMHKSVFTYLLFITAVVSMLSNGVFPSIQSYSCLPYGNVAYHFAVTLSNMANPAVCFLAFFLPQPTSHSITTMTLLSFTLSGYVMATAVMSPSPPLVGELSGEILLIVSWIILKALFTYIRVSAATLLRGKGQKGLLWCGAITQVGSAMGAIVTFFVVNYTKTFKAFYPCT